MVELSALMVYRIGPPGWKKLVISWYCCWKVAVLFDMWSNFWVKNFGV